jgi:hypothetical protein
VGSNDRKEKGESVLKGIMAEILSEEMAAENLEVPFIEFPALSDPNSEKRKKFWGDLQNAVENRNVFNKKR